MNAIAILGAVKLFIDIIEGGPAAAIKGVITTVMPGSDFYTIGSSINYIFDLTGNYCGEIDINKFDKYNINELKIMNQEDFDIAFSSYDFPKLAERQFAEMKSINFIKREFPKF